jgi:hypothetical protein
MVSVAPYTVVEMIAGISAMYAFVVLATLVRIIRESKDVPRWHFKGGTWGMEKAKYGWAYGLAGLVAVIIIGAFPVRFGTVMLINGCALAVLVREVVLIVRLVMRW